MKYQGVYSHHDYKSEYSVTDIASPDAEGECPNHSPDAVITIRQTDCGLTSHHHQTGTGAPVITPYRPTGSGEMGEELGINPYYKSLWPLSE